MSQAAPRPPIVRPTRRPAPAVLIVGVLFVAMIGLSLWYLTRREPLVIQGEVQSRTFDMAARVDGRVGQIVVARSQDVLTGGAADPHRQSGTDRQGTAERGRSACGRGRTGAGSGGFPCGNNRGAQGGGRAGRSGSDARAEDLRADAATRHDARCAAIAVRQGQRRVDARGAHARPGASCLQRGGGRLHARGPEHRACQGRERQGGCRDAQGAGGSDGCRRAGR